MVGTKRMAGVDVDKEGEMSIYQRVDSVKRTRISKQGQKDIDKQEATGRKNRKRCVDETLKIEEAQSQRKYEERRNRSKVYRPTNRERLSKRDE